MLFVFLLLFFLRVPALPNVIVFFADDMGWGDLSSYGHPTQERGPIDDILIDGGMRFTQWYSAASMCSPSRASLLTGRLPIRNGVFSANHGARVFWTNDKYGLPHSEITIAELVKAKGYATGMSGKWHLGINYYNSSDGSHLPNTQGFDNVGPLLPFSNHFKCDEKLKPDPSVCMLYYNTTIVQQPIRHSNLTSWITEHNINFIKNSVE
eukprot:UN32523